jgi:hypothetical protein
MLHTETYLHKKKKKIDMHHLICTMPFTWLPFLIAKINYLLPYMYWYKIPSALI